MPWSDDLRQELRVRAMINQRAAAFPGEDGFPYVEPPEAELERACDWILRRQNSEGFWPQDGGTYRFYADSYGVRGLLAAREILGREDYARAACKWIERILELQRPDGGWWVGYSWGDHDFHDPTDDRTVVYVADAGEVSAGLVVAHGLLKNRAETAGLASRIRHALVKFRAYADQFRLASGAIGLGYTERDFYKSTPAAKVRRPFMQAHHRPFPFATAVTGVGFYAGLSAVTGDAGAWRDAMRSLDWCLENLRDERQGELDPDAGRRLELRVLGRCMDTAFRCCPAPLDKAAPTRLSSEPLYQAPERQKLYGVWKYVVHHFAETQSDAGEWPLRAAEGDAIARFNTGLRHRMYFLYSLVSYLQAGHDRPEEDKPLRHAAARQMWLCADRDVLADHYGVAGQSCIIMPTGLWAMTLAELLRPGVTLPADGGPRSGDGSHTSPSS